MYPTSWLYYKFWIKVDRRLYKYGGSVPQYIPCEIAADGYFLDGVEVKTCTAIDGAPRQTCTNPLDSRVPVNCLNGYYKVPGQIESGTEGTPSYIAPTADECIPCTSQVGCQPGYSDTTAPCTAGNEYPCTAAEPGYYVQGDFTVRQCSPIIGATGVT